jgi:hypothetical protein
LSSTPWFKHPQTSADSGSDSQDTALARMQLATDVNTAVDQIERSPTEARRRENLLFWYELYLGRKIGDLYSIDSAARERVWDRDDLVFNLCYAIVCTIRNRICSFRPRAQFLPNDGDFRDGRVAREQTDMSDAWARKVRWQDEASLMFRDVIIGDGGVLKMGIEGKGSRRRVDLGRYPPWEFLFDEVESIYRKPECGYHVTYIPIENAAATYGLSVAQLSSGIVSAPTGIRYNNDRNLVRRVEAWRNGPDEGRRVVTIGQQTVADDDWPYDGPPLVTRTFDEGIIGKWGAGAVEVIRDLQLELNETHTRMKEGHAMTAMQRIAVQESEDAPSKVTNATIAIDRYKNQPPTYGPVTPMDDGWFKYAEYLKKLGYETLGISPFIAAGVKQPGTTSALAIQESTELQQDRLALLSQSWEGMVVDTGEWWDRLNAELVSQGVPQTYRAIRFGASRELKFPEGDMRREVRVYPSSIFGSTYSGRLERAQYLIDKQWLSREDAMRVADVPDLSPVIDQQLAEAYAMEKICDDILETGQYVQPPPYLDAAQLFTYARKRWLLAWTTERFPEEHLAQLSKLIDAIKPKAEAAPPGPPGILGALPPGMPLPPPPPGMQLPGMSPGPQMPIPPGPGGPPPGAPPPPV